ncbi:MAG TPA: transcription elongation factor GreA [Beijerinckiaceae bacterium]|nr:transcription elongation factor GreA [Beijerinckiaceae bacterium]
MSVAFTKEPDVELLEDLPDRPISPHRNLVTAEGLARIEQEVERLQHELTQLQITPQDEQSPEERAATARVARDLRYWTARRSSAELVPPMVGTDRVHFASKVTIEREDGRRHTYRIVGEDEADPSQGLISHVSPLAKALIGRRVGESAKFGNNEAAVIHIA